MQSNVSVLSSALAVSCTSSLDCESFVWTPLTASCELCVLSPPDPWVSEQGFILATDSGFSCSGLLLANGFVSIETILKQRGACFSCSHKNICLKIH